MDLQYFPSGAQVHKNEGGLVEASGSVLGIISGRGPLLGIVSFLLASKKKNFSPRSVEASVSPQPV